MNGINGFHVYQSDFVKGLTQGSYEKKAANGAETKHTQNKKGANEANGVKKGPALSDDAQDMLERLKEKYSNMDFIVANYDSDEEAQKYLAGGTKEYSVLMEPEVLEEMAADEKAEKKYTNMIEEATAKLSDIKDQLGDEEDTVTRLGISFGKDGSVSYFAELEKSGEKQRERIEKSRAEKKEAAKKAEKAEDEKRRADLTEKTKRVRVSAKSAEGLLDKIRNVDWDSIRPQQRETIGSIIDYGA